MDSNNKLEMSNAELLQQLSTLVWLQDKDSTAYRNITLGRIANEIWLRISGEPHIEALRNQTIASIAAYVKEHPKAKEDELVQEIQKQIEQFKNSLENI